MAHLDERFVGPLEGHRVDLIIQDALRLPGNPESTREPEPYISTDGPVLNPLSARQRILPSRQHRWLS